MWVKGIKTKSLDDHPYCKLSWNNNIDHNNWMLSFILDVHLITSWSYYTSSTNVLNTANYAITYPDSTRL